MSSVPVRRSSIDAITNSIPAVRPWLTIWYRPPTTPCVFRAKMPSTMKPRWEIEE
jgi:hypothetical protein